ncbi:hypothetical protein HW555_013037, partial [Spodoptera exigua]
IIQAMEQQLRNFKKDSADRKTPANIKKRLQILDSYWREFQENHAKLGEFEDRGYAYFSENMYDKARIFYNEAQNIIQNYKPPTSLEKGGKSPSTSSIHTSDTRNQEAADERQQTSILSVDPDKSNIKPIGTPSTSLFKKIVSRGNASKLEEMLRKQKSNFKALSRAIRNVDIESLSEKWEFEDVLKTIQGKWSTIDSLHWEIDSEMYSEDEEYEQEYSNHEQQYVDIKKYNNDRLIFTSHMNILLSIPTMQNQVDTQIKNMFDTINECMNSLKNLGVDVTAMGPMVVHLLTLKLDTQTLSEYTQSLDNPRALPVLADFLNFLENKYTALESTRRKHYSSKSSSSSSPSRNKDSEHQVSKKNQSKSNNFNNKIDSNKPFLQSGSAEKRNTVQRFNLCENCLVDHKNKSCRSESRCRVCQGTHNTVLHDALQVNAVSSNMDKSPSMSCEDKTQSNVTHACKESVVEILLATALVRIQGINGEYHTMRALIDQGSQASLITENAAQILKLPRRACKGVIVGVSANQTNCKGVLSLVASSLHSNYTFQTEVVIMKKLINNLPNHSFSKPSWEYLQNIQLADRHFNVCRPIDLLLGAEVYSEIIMSGIIKENSSLPIAQQTQLGWVLSGNVKSYQCNVIMNNIEDIQRDQITQCNVVRLQLLHGYNELEHYNNVLLGQQGQVRRRRGLINGIGYVTHSLFGVLDETFAEQYQKDIALLRSSQKHLSNLWRNQTSIVEAELNVIKRIENTLDKQHKMLNQHIINCNASMNKLKEEIQHTDNKAEFTLSTFIANNIMTYLKEIQETLVDTVANIYYEKFNFHLLTPTQLKNELNVITGQISKDLALPINNIQTDLAKIYHLLKVKARATRKFLIFEVRIPLVSREDYELYNLIPIPQQSNTSMVTIVPVAKYLAINTHKDAYIPVSTSDLQKCVPYSADEYICPLKRPVFQMTSDKNLCLKHQASNKCQTETTECQDTWTDLNLINSYLYFCCGQCRRLKVILLIFCSVLINLSIPFIAPLNETDDIIKQQEDIKAIEKTLKEMKSNQELEDQVTFHDIHHYVAIYTLVGVVVVCIILYAWLRMRACQPRPALAPPAAEQVETTTEQAEASVSYVAPIDHHNQQRVFASRPDSIQ